MRNLLIMMRKSLAQPSHDDDYVFDPQKEFYLVLVLFSFQLLVLNIFISICLNSRRIWYNKTNFWWILHFRDLQNLSNTVILSNTLWVKMLLVDFFFFNLLIWFVISMSKVCRLCYSSLWRFCESLDWRRWLGVWRKLQ